MTLIAIQPHEIELGAPLEWPLLDAEGRVLFHAGQTLENDEELQRLLTAGLYRFPSQVPPEVDSELLASAEPSPRLLLNPGDLLQIQPWTGEGAGERYMVKVVGHMAPFSLMVTAPSANGKLLFVREGHIFLVRGFIGQDAMAYRARVLKTQLTPFPYLHLVYPDAVQSTRIRKSVRAPVNLVCAISGPGGNSAGRITDISLGGAKIVSSTPFAASGEEVRLAFRVDPAGIELYLNVRALVRGAQAESLEQSRHTTGVEFVELSEQERLALMGMLYQNILKDNV